MAYRTALITGASSGIGLALARQLGRNGTRVVLAARRRERLDAAVAELVAEGAAAQALTLDVTDTTAAVAAIRAVDAEVDGLELVVANAGLSGPINGARFAWETIAPMCQTNFAGAIATLTAVLPQMVARRRGHLVAVSSLAAHAPMPFGAPYCGSKAGLTMFLECLRMDLRGTGVAVTAVHPGFVKTPATAHVTQAMPFAVTGERAAEIIATQLAGLPPTIDFPRPMAVAMHVLAGLPRGAREMMLRRFPVVDEQ